MAKAPRKEGKPESNSLKIKVTKNGPYLVCGKVPLSKQVITVDKEGNPEKWKEEKKFDSQETYALCRCGKSSNKPFCDGTHIDIQFKDDK